MSSRKRIIICLLCVLAVLALFATSCRSKNSIVGKWQYVSSKNGYDAFQYDIEFYKDGTCYIESPFLWSNTLDYSFPDDGKIKFLVGAMGDVVEYSLEGDRLILYFGEGYNEYKRIK